jgi:hypothetical protein
MIYTHVLGRGGHGVLSPADGEFRQLDLHPHVLPPAEQMLVAAPTSEGSEYERPDSSTRRLYVYRARH